MTIREFKMPDVGEGLTEAEILKWYVQPGDTVADGQVVCEVETAKAAVELPIPFDGVVHALLFEEGVTVDVGQVIISVRTGPAEEAPEAAAPAAVAAPAAAEEPVAEVRQPVLVGYGVSTASTKRRPARARPRRAPLRPPPWPRATARPSRRRSYRPSCRLPWFPRRTARHTPRPPVPSVRWRSHRCASSPRTSASTWPW